MRLALSPCWRQSSRVRSSWLPEQRHEGSRKTLLVRYFCLIVTQIGSAHAAAGQQDSVSLKNNGPSSPQPEQNRGVARTPVMSSQVLDHPATNSTAGTDAVSASLGDGLAGVEIVRDKELRETDQRPEPVEAGPAVEPRDAVSDDEQTVISKRSSRSDGSSSHASQVVTAAALRTDLGNALEGICLGHFQLEKFVGGGGMGSVFRGTDLRLGRTVAIKVLSRDRTDSETLRRFQNEAQSAARLDHDNIARVYYVGEDQGLHFIVFEFIEGVNIRDLVDKHGPLPLADAISYTLQVAAALEHASQRHVVHRDIKPSNVLVTAEGRAKLVDMGLARLRIEASRAKVVLDLAGGLDSRPAAENGGGVVLPAVLPALAVGGIERERIKRRHAAIGLLQRGLIIPSQSVIQRHLRRDLPCQCLPFRIGNSAIQQAEYTLNFPDKFT